MKRHCWGTILLLVLLSSCANLPSLLAQTSRSPLAPQKMRLCVTFNGKTDCNTLTWASEFYEARKDGETKIDSRFWIVHWGQDGVELQGKTNYAAANNFPLELTFKAPISADGLHISGVADWHVGYGSSGTIPFTLTWTKTIAVGGKSSPGKPAEQVANEAEVGDISVYSPARPSTNHPNIMLPPGASEKFAEYPDDVRAILQPEYGLTVRESKFHCPVEVDHDADADTALEIARFNYRAGEMLTGHCWLGVAIRKGSTRARVVYAVGLQMGWYGKKDDAKAFGIYKELLATRDPWAIWFLHECYSDGIGTPKDPHQAAILDSWIMTHEDGMNVVRTLGTDDSDQMREKARWDTLLNPPMKSASHCTQDYVTAGGVKVPGRCDSQSVIDKDALQIRLRQIDQQ